MPLSAPAVNAPWLALALGCQAPAEAPRAASLRGADFGGGSVGVANGLRAALEDHPEAAVDRDLSLAQGWRAEGPPPPDAVLPDRIVAAEVGALTLTGATLDDSLGADLLDRLEDFSTSQLNRWGLGLLGPEELFGDGSSPGLCEMPAIQSTVSTGEELSLAVYTYSALVGDPTPMWVSISRNCTAGLEDAGGAIDAAVAAGDCAEDEARTFFAEGSACTACVEGNGGDYDACNAAGTCPTDVPLAVWVSDSQGDKHWYRGVYADALGCAPDLLAQFYFLADMGEDGVLPRAFDHEAWAYICTPLWNEADEAVDTLCLGSEEPVSRGVLAEGLFGYVNDLGPEDDGVSAWRGRQYYVDAVAFTNGATISWFWASNPGLGVVSAPRLVADSNEDGVIDAGDEDYGYGYGGYGFDPGATRPDGQIMARDWLAALTMKTATTIDGVAIVPYQTNRCASWEGPASDGSWRCTSLSAPEGGWINDLYATWSDTDRSRAVSFPLTTLGSTGQIDDDVPGGVVTHIAGTATLASPDWDDCVLPHRFVPDVAAIEDGPLGAGQPALDAQTWRFDREQGLDLRLALATNTARGWCGGSSAGGGRSALDL